MNNIEFRTESATIEMLCHTRLADTALPVVVSRKDTAYVAECLATHHVRHSPINHVNACAVACHSIFFVNRATWSASRRTAQHTKQARHVWLHQMESSAQHTHATARCLCQLAPGKRTL